MSPPEPNPTPPRFLVPRSLIYITIFIVAAAFSLTLFVRNPYTQAVSGDFYEKGFLDNSAVLWLIFIGTPALLYYLYVRRRGGR